MSDRLNIVVADDHKLLRQALGAFLREPPLLANVHEASDYEQCRELCGSLKKVDLALVDLFMPPTPGMAGIKRLREDCPTVKLVVISGLATQTEMDTAEALGVSGFLSKDISREALVSVIEKVTRGERYFSSAPASIQQMETQAPDTPLTPRQRDVLTLLAKGLTNKEIARILDLSPATVKIHVATTLKVLGAQNRTEAAHFARALGLVDAGEPLDKK